MDFTDRSMRQPQPAHNNSGASSPAQPSQPKKPSRFQRIKNHKLLNITYVTLLFSITVLIVGVAYSIYIFDGNRNKEEQFIDTGKYQAVFLNGGQVYFGKVAEANSSYVTLADIYYLTPNQAVQSDNKNNAASNNFTIRKLGCELHRPQDVMVINHDQIIFWENLKDDSSENTVPGAIKKLSQQPQNCEQQTQSNGSSSNNAANSNNTSNGSGTNSSNNTPSSGQ